MAEDPLALAAAVAALIAHDLASPIGAAAAAAETAEDPDVDDAFRADALKLGGDSLRRAAAALRFLRAAYGPAPGDVASVALSAREMAADKDVRLDWPPEATPTPAAARLAALATHALCGSAQRGRIDVSAPESGGLRITAEGPRFKTEGFEAPRDGPKSAPWRLIAALAAQDGRTFRWAPDGGNRLAIHLSPEAP